MKKNNGRSQRKIKGDPAHNLYLRLAESQATAKQGAILQVKYSGTLMKLTAILAKVSLKQVLDFIFKNFLTTCTVSAKII